MDTLQSSVDSGESGYHVSESILGVGISKHVYTLDESMADTDFENIEVVASSQMRSLIKFYNLALKQSQVSFNLAVISAGIGILFFIASVTFMLVSQSQDLARIALISGALIEAISAIVFYLYKKTTDQLAQYRGWLDSTQRFLLANRVCDGMQGRQQQLLRADIVRIFIKDINHSAIRSDITES